MTSIEQTVTLHCRKGYFAYGMSWCPYSVRVVEHMKTHKNGGYIYLDTIENGDKARLILAKYYG
jgi:predicted metal-binding protein